MINEKLAPEELAIIRSALTALEDARAHFRLRDLANAKLHLQAVKYSPITKRLIKASNDLLGIIDDTPEDSIL